MKYLKNWKVYESFSDMEEQIISNFAIMFGSLESTAKSIAIENDLNIGNNFTNNMVLDVIFNQIINISKGILDKKDSGEDSTFLHNAIITNLQKVLEKWRPRFINESWVEIGKLIAKDFCGIMSAAIRAYANKWAESKWSGEDISKMSPSELDSEVNLAINQKDWDRLLYLSNFIKVKESVTELPYLEEQIKSIIKKGLLKIFSLLDI
jgi:hypothetical protein